MESSHQTSSSPSTTETSLCVNNCGFFGNPATEGLCSKCWRDAEAQRQRLAPLEPAQPPSQLRPASSPAADVVPSTGSTQVVAPTDVAIPAATSPHSVEAASLAVADAALAATPARPVQANRNRCFGCNKKVGLLGFECRCGYVFCASHRHAVDHACSFDYVTLDKARLASQNPVVTAAKLDNRL